MGLAQFAAQTLVPGLIGGALYAMEGVRGLRNRAEHEAQE
jgi:hypothetical protein